MPPGVSKTTVESLASRVDQLERFVPFAFLTAKGVQALLGWSRSTFYRRLPELPARTRWGWRLADLRAAIQAGQIPYPSGGH